jgi:hypothetical protein
MSNEPTNAHRAAWAKDALAVFTAATFGDHPDRMDRGDLECAVGDLIADLLHFAVQQGFDAGSVMNWACGHFGCELLEEASQGLTMLDHGITSELIEALHLLLQETVDMDLKHGITLSEGEEEARAKALAAIARAAEAMQRRSRRHSPSTSNR